jgi:hypothetical protein
MRSIVFCLALLFSVYQLEAQQSTSRPVSEYLMMKGSIGKYPVVFHLYRINNNIDGYYYYEHFQQPVQLQGKIDGKKMQLIYYDREEENNNEQINAILNNSSVTGTWISGKKKLNIVLKASNDSLLDFQYVSVSGKRKIPKTPFTSVDEVSYEALSVWPTENSVHPATGLVKSSIRAEFDKQNSSDEIRKIMLAEKNATLNFNNGDSEMINYAVENKVRIIYRDARFLSLAHFKYDYTGGAHGNYGTNYTCIDLQKEKKLELSDLLDTFEARYTLKTLLEKAYREQYNIPDEQSVSETLLVDSIPISDNFFVTGKYLAFGYNPYEIGAYAMGEILLYVPLKDLAGYLRPGILRETDSQQ